MFRLLVKKNSDQRNSLFVLKKREKHSYFKEWLRGEPLNYLHIWSTKPTSLEHPNSEINPRILSYSGVILTSSLRWNNSRWNSLCIKVVSFQNMNFFQSKSFFGTGAFHNRIFPEQELFRTWAFLEYELFRTKFF